MLTFGASKMEYTQYKHYCKYNSRIHIHTIDNIAIFVKAILYFFYIYPRKKN